MASFVVSVDGFGRLLIPKRVREGFKSREFSLLVEKGEMRLKPLKTWDGLFGSSPELSVEQLRQLRKEDAENDEKDLSRHLRAR